MSVGSTGYGGEPRDHHVGTEGANDTHDVAEHFRLVPDAKGLEVVFRESKVQRAREELTTTVNATGGEQFLRAGDAELVTELGAEEVLTAVAASDGEICGAHVATAREIGDELRVLVVRMRADVQHGRHHPKVLELLKNFRRAE